MRIENNKQRKIGRNSSSGMDESVAERHAAAGDSGMCRSTVGRAQTAMKRTRDGASASALVKCGPTGKAAGVVMLIVSVLAASGCDAFSPNGHGGGMIANNPLSVGLRYRGNVQAVNKFATTSTTSPERSRPGPTRHMKEVDNSEGKLKELPEGGNSGVGAADSYLYNITGSEEERAKETNKVKLREAVNEVKGKARVVKEKTKKLKEEVLKEDVKVVEAPLMFEDATATYEDNVGRKLKQNENGKSKSKKVREVAATLGEVTESTAKLGETVVKKSPSILGRLFLLLVSTDMRKDLNRRKVHYISDWVDGLKSKRQTIPAILFLYFACLSPAVSFGTISSQITNGSIGVVEFLLSCGLSGMVSLWLFEAATAVFVVPRLCTQPICCSSFFPRTGVLSSLRTADGVHRTDRADTRVYIRSLPAVYLERSAFLSRLRLGRYMDVFFHDQSRYGRIVASHSLLHSLHRRSIQWTFKSELYLRGCFVVKTELHQCAGFQ